MDGQHLRPPILAAVANGVVYVGSDSYLPSMRPAGRRTAPGRSHQDLHGAMDG